MTHERAPGDWPARLKLHPTAFIAPGAVVVGEVTMGERASVWFQCALRGDTDAIVIGAGSNIQDLSVVHVDAGQPAVIGARVTVGHRAVVHGCVIEDDCLIGMGAVLLSGARIGTGSLVAAGALVREGQVVPPGSLAVGAPARVVGAVSEGHTAAIRRGAAHYAELALSYQRRGFARPHPLPASDRGTVGVRGEPMSYAEWGRLLRILAEGPARVRERAATVGEAWRAAPTAGGWSAHAVVAHLAQVDEGVYLPRIARLLDEVEPAFEDVDPTAWVESVRDAWSSTEALDRWRASRERLVLALRLLGPADWRRLAWHSLRGPYPLGLMVRDWVEHDLAHRRQIQRALLAAGAPA